MFPKQITQNFIFTNSKFVKKKIKYPLYISWEFIVHQSPCYRQQSIEKEIAHDPIPNILQIRRQWETHINK